jgi:ABC transporter substrate binding protein
MKRREFITLAGGAVVVCPFAALAQQPTMPVVGVLRDATAAGSEFVSMGCARDWPRQASSKVGISPLSMPGPTAGASGCRRTAELGGRHVPVIVSSVLNATYAAKAATSTIPVVFAVNNDPVATKLVASLSRPGGNLTGVAYLGSALAAKRLGLMHEMVPRLPTSPCSHIRPIRPPRRSLAT